jgi:large subunit ribosomal protein L29
MTSEELRAKTADEISKIILDLRKEQFNARFQKSQGTMEKTDSVRKNRRTIARAKTILNEKRRAEAAASAKKAA